MKKKTGLLGLAYLFVLSVLPVGITWAQNIEAITQEAKKKMLANDDLGAFELLRPHSVNFNAEAASLYGIILNRWLVIQGPYRNYGLTPEQLKDSTFYYLKKAVAAGDKDACGEYATFFSDNDAPQNRTLKDLKQQINMLFKSNIRNANRLQIAYIEKEISSPRRKSWFDSLYTAYTENKMYYDLAMHIAHNGWDFYDDPTRNKLIYENMLKYEQSFTQLNTPSYFEIKDYSSACIKIAQRLIEENNITKAVQRLKTALIYTPRSADAIYTYTDLYLNEKIKPFDKEKVIALFKLNEGYANIADLFTKGNLIPQNIDSALHYLNTGEKSLHYYHYRIGGIRFEQAKIYISDKYGKRDYKKTLDYLYFIPTRENYFTDYDWNAFWKEEDMNAFLPLMEANKKRLDGFLLNKIGNYYTNNNDFKKAYEYYEKSATANYEWGNFNMGNYIFKGQGVKQDIDKGFGLMIKAANRTSADNGEKEDIAKMQYRLAYNYWTVKNFKEAVVWFDRAKDDSWYEAYNFLGMAYYGGIGGINQDYEKAVEYWQKGLEKGNAGSASNLAQQYISGKGVAKDFNKAKELLKRGCELAGNDPECWQCKAVTEGEAEIKKRGQTISF